MIETIVITHGYSDSNKGDLAITQAIVQGLKKSYPSATIYLMSTFRIADPDFWYHNRKMKSQGVEIVEGILPTPYMGSNSSFLVHLQAVLRLFKDFVQLKISQVSGFLGERLGGTQNKALQIMKTADLVIVKGGQYIYNDKEDLRGNLFMWRTLQPIKIAKKLNKKVVVLGQSIGGFASAKSEKRAMKYLRKCDLIVVREKLSFQLLEKHGITQIALKPDMAFLIQGQPVTPDQALTNNMQLLGITVVNWSFPGQKDVKATQDQYVSNLIEAVEYAYHTQELLPVFIPQVTVRHHGKSDLDLIEEMGVMLEKRNIPFFVIDQDYDSSQMVGLYSKCKILIGTRLHSCILASNAGTPVIAIRYQGFKTQGVMEMLGFESFVHDINNLRAGDLISDIAQINGNYEHYKGKIEESASRLRKEAEAIFTDFL